jgi:hypothetical protein
MVVPRWNARYTGDGAYPPASSAPCNNLQRRRRAHLQPEVQIQMNTVPVAPRQAGRVAEWASAEARRLSSGTRSRSPAGTKARIAT